MPRSLSLALLLFAALPAHAVIVRGKVTTQLGAPLSGARVQLISVGQGAQSVADSISGVDGSYELRSDLSGRFLIIALPSVLDPRFAPQIGNAFYAGRTDLLNLDIALDATAITPQLSAQPTLLPTPLRQIASEPAQVAADQFLTQAGIVPELRPHPAALIVQQGQFGEPAYLLLRGAPVSESLIDGVQAEQLGGRFNLATVSSSGLGAISATPALELTRGASSLHGLDAQNGVLALRTPLASSVHPTLVYAVDAGNLSTLRNEAIATIADRRADALASIARLNTDNDLPAQRLHLITSAANLGYHISGNTSLRVTLRDDVDATPLPSPFRFYDVASSTRLAEQNLVGSATFETRTSGDWHNLIRYGLVRDRTQAFHYATPNAGLFLTIAGANGYTATGTANFLPFPAREDAVTNRDQYTYQTDYPVTHFLTALLTLHYQDERGADLTASQSERLERRHLSVAASLQGELKHRLFYQASGFFDHSSATGLNGSPSLGLTYAPVRPGLRRFRGTSLHLTAAAGSREPSVLETELLHTSHPPRSRTFDVSADQTILPKKLTLRATYFHSQLSQQIETLNLAPLTLSNALAYRAQGLESELRYQPTSRLLLDGGYTYLASLVEQSAAVPSFNLNLPGIAIGATTALTGARPFDRSPNSGFLAAQYTGVKFSAAFKSAFAGRSDGSTRLVLNPTLLLPNRNLSPGYASIDASVTCNITHAIMLYSQFNNLANDRHVAPIGYLSTPFSVRLGIRVRLGRE
jgi:iron complex outermembrane receptor protein/vitamin B12 transporter